MPDHTISITLTQYKMLLCVLPTPTEWINHIAFSKIADAERQIILYTTKWNPSKLTQQEKDDIISDLDLDALKLEMLPE